MKYCIFKEAVDILKESSGENKNFDELRTVLEDANSPITRKYHEKLYQSVINRSHINFGNIPESKGDIRHYVGYASMLEILKNIESIGVDEKNVTVVAYVKTIKKAIATIESLTPVFEKGFDVNSEYVELEYNTYVYTCVEATTSLLYEFVEYVKRPDNNSLQISLKNNTVRANLFYYEQLQKFNNLNDKMGVEYRKMLEASISKDKNNFIGSSTLIGLGAVSIVALSVIPITRSLIFNLYKLRGDISKDLEMQAKFLELNKTCIEANSAFDEVKRNKIIAKQAAMAKVLTRMAEVMRVKSVKASVEAKKELAVENKTMSIDNMRDDISNSSFELL